MEPVSQAINRYIVKVEVRTGFNIASCEVGEDRHIAVVIFRREHRDEDYTRDRIEFDPVKDPNGSKAMAKLRVTARRYQKHFDRTGERLDRLRKVA